MSFPDKLEKDNQKSIEIPNDPMRSSISTLQELDTAGKGYLDASDVRVAIHELRWMRNAVSGMRKVVLFLTAFTVMLVIGMFASSYMAIQLAKDIGVQKGKLVDTDGNGVSTVQQAESVHGIRADSRQLAETGTIVGVMSITKTYFEKASADFRDGKLEIMAVLPDGSSRKVTVTGGDANGLWGHCGSWPYRFVWDASCPAGMPTECVINYKADTAGCGSQHLLKARANITSGQDMQRALQSIKRPAYY